MSETRSTHRRSEKYVQNFSRKTWREESA